MSSVDSLDPEESCMEASKRISKRDAIFIFYLASRSTERVSSDRKRRPELDIQQLVTWHQQGFKERRCSNGGTDLAALPY